MKTFLLLSGLIALAFGIGTPNATATESTVGYVQLEETPNAPLGFFERVPFVENEIWRGEVAGTSANVLTAVDAAWTADQFVFETEVQPRHWFVEMLSGDLEGQTFDVTQNSSDSLTVIETLAAINNLSAGDEFRIVSHWSLNLLFPEGRSLMGTNGGTQGTSIAFPEVDFETRFVYHEAFSRWVDQADLFTDVGDEIIRPDSLLYIRQGVNVPIQPLMGGHKAADERGLRVAFQILDTTAPPTNLTATDGATLNQIGLSWLNYPGTGTLDIYRSQTNDIFTATVVGTSDTNFWSDDFPTQGEIFYYWVMAAPFGEAPSSNVDAGHARLTAPQSLSASGNNPDEIEISWSAVANADVYELYRSTTPDFETASEISAGTSTTFLDGAALPAVLHYYWAVARSADGIRSEPSTGDSGVRNSGPGGTITTPGTGGTPLTTLPLAATEEAAGSYYGLLYQIDENSGEFTLKGDISVRVSQGRDSINETLTLNFEEIKYRLRGTMNPDGSSTFEFLKKDEARTPMTLTFQSVAVVDPEAGDTRGRKLEGGLRSDGELVQADIPQLLFHKKLNPAPMAGAYTLAMPTDPDADAATRPGGDGIAAGKIATSGRGKFVAILGDGTKTSFITQVTPGLEMMFYRRLYKREATGRIGGIMNFRDVDNTSVADGTLHWQKGARERERLYAEGFDLQQPVVASHYRVPNSRAGERVISEFSDADENAVLRLSGGNLGPVPEETRVHWNTRNRFVKRGDIDLSAVTILSNGLVRGKWNDKTTRTKISWNGVAFQQQGLIVGNFIGDGQTGFATVQSTAHPELIVSDAFTITAINNGSTEVFDETGIDGGFSEIAIRIENAGDGVLHLNQRPQLINSDESFFLTDSFSGSIAPNTDAIVQIRFQPETEGEKTATLLLLTNDETNNPYELHLTGQAVSGNGGSGELPLGLSHVDQSSSVPSSFATSATQLRVEQSGNYEGLLLADSPGAETLGTTRFKMAFNSRTGLGGLSGQIYTQGSRWNVRGTINENGAIEASFSGRGSENLVASMSLQETDLGGFQVVGTLSDSESGEHFVLAATHTSWHKSHNPAPVAGRYTMILPANEELGDVLPGGDGFATVSVSTAGQIKAAFVLGDGTRTSVANILSSDLQWNLFRELYSTRPKGKIGGLIFFLDQPEISDFDGELQWVKPASNRERLFPGGFTMRIPAVGSRFVSPARGDRILSQLADSAYNAELVFDRGNLAPEIPAKLLTWSEANQFTADLTDTERLSMSASTRSGLIRGRYQNRALGSNIPFTGVAFQKQGIASGNFIGEKSTGFFTILPTIQ